ncbi:MAG: phosphatidylserine decarboxylase [Acidobacteriota bacterium]
MKIAEAGVSFVAAGALLTVVSAALGAWLVAVPALVLTGYLSFFFRDPDRTTPEGDGLVIAPGDGRVLSVDAEGEHAHLSIFLGLLDVHVNRAPCSGRVVDVEHLRGEYLAAFRADAGERNEQCRVTIRTGAGDVTMQQVVGLAARRVEFWPEEGSDIQAGERVGIMKFGSRIDLQLPAGTSFEVGEGDRLCAGETVLGRLPGAGS